MPPFHQLLQRVIKTVEFLKLSLSPLYDTLIHDQDFLHFAQPILKLSFAQPILKLSFASLRIHT